MDLTNAPNRNRIGIASVAFTYATVTGVTACPDGARETGPGDARRGLVVSGTRTSTGCAQAGLTIERPVLWTGRGSCRARFVVFRRPQRAVVRDAVGVWPGQVERFGAAQAAAPRLPTRAPWSLRS